MLLCFYQEVLRCLHTHLGSRIAPQTSAAIETLLQLASSNIEALLSYAAFLTSIMEYLEDYDSKQLHQVLLALQAVSMLNISARMTLK